MDTEFTCRNNMCIEHEFAFDLWPDCLDGSDEINDTNCEQEGTSVECNERRCPSDSPVPCGNGQCLVDVTDGCAFSSILQTYSRESNLELNDECYDHLLCSLFPSTSFKRARLFHFLGINLQCPCNEGDNDCLEDLSFSCMKEYVMFPTDAVTSPDIHFMYSISNVRQSGMNIFKPLYACSRKLATCTGFSSTYISVTIMTGWHCIEIRSENMHYNTMDYDTFALIIKQEITEKCFNRYFPP